MLTLEPIILTKKLPSQTWKEIVLKNNFNKISSFILKEYTDENKIIKQIIKFNYEFIKNLIKNQHYHNIDIYELYKLNSKFKQILLNNKLLNKEKLKINNYISQIEILIDECFFSNIYYPQITIDNEYYRLYYHPIFKFDKLLINTLFLKTNFSKYSILIDIKNAIFRVCCLFLYKYTNNDFYLKLYNTKDIYLFLTKNEFKNEIKNIKLNLIKYINYPKKDIEIYLKKVLKYNILIDFKKIINKNICKIRKLLTLYCNKNLYDIQNMFSKYYSFYFFINLDGGILLLNSKPTNDEILKLKNNKFLSIKIKEDNNE